MKYLFWICWSVEVAASLFWILNEVKLQHIAPSPWSMWVGLYLVIVLALRFGFDANKVSAILVALPALPFLAMRLLFSYMPYNELSVIKTRQ